MWIADAERTRSLEYRSAQDYGLSPEILMERAGAAVFDALNQFSVHEGRVAVLCGPGNNGGDGLVVARLASQRGYRVDVIVASPEANLQPLTTKQLQLARAAGIEPIFSDDARWGRKLVELAARDVIIDALLGIGASREVHGPILEGIQAINRSGVPVISVDVPSGICCDSGEELGESVWALRTVTFGRAKPFLFQGIGLEHSGYWSVSEIGLPQTLLGEPTSARLLDSDWVANLLPERLRASHKGENGHVLIVAGSRFMRGAAVLAAGAALATGAGIVTVASIPCVCDAVIHALPEAIVLPLPEVGGFIDPSAIELVSAYEHKFSSAVIGPGIGLDPATFAFVDRFFKEWTKPLVIDADAITIVARGVQPPKSECVFTPHPGELSRLLHCSIAEIQADRFRSARMAVAEMRQTVLLKGPYSIVGEPGQPMLVNSTGNSGQASAGMGDVLAGVIGTLLSQDLPGYYAAASGMFWQGAAADLCAQEIGPIGYRASDVIQALPRARARIVASCSER